MDPLFFYELLSWFLLAIAAGATAFLLRRALPAGRLLGPQRQRAVPWRLLDLILVFILTQELCQALLVQLLTAWYHADPLPDRVRYLARPCLSVLLQVPVAILTLMISAKARFYQLGLTTHGWRQNVVVGLVAWLVVTPIVYGVNYLASLLYLLVQHAPPIEHPVMKVVKSGSLGGADWVMTFLAVCVAAPVFEELLFRGILQPWARSVAWGGDVAMSGALVLAFASGHEQAGWAPTLFVLAMLPGYLLVGRSRRLRPRAARSIYATALLFAAAHSSVWPSPIALFPLGLALGWLAYRTQSLVGPVVLHSLFNGMTFLALLLAYGRGPLSESGKPATIASIAPAAVATVTAVPGASCPRRK